MLETSTDWLDYLRTYETGAVRIDPTIHSHVFGRARGMGVFVKMMEIAIAADDIWVGTRGQAVDHIIKNYG